MVETDTPFAALRQAADPAAVAAMERLVREAPDHALNRINALAFARVHGLDENRAIDAFLHATRRGLFEMSWNMLCPGCGGVLDGGVTLRSLRRDEYCCTLCAADYEPTLDEMVEVAFTVCPRVRRIAAHDPDSLPMVEYMRQIFWGTGQDLPDDLAARLDEVMLDAVELPPGGTAILSLRLPAEFVIVFDPVTHATRFLDVKGPPASGRQALSLVIDRTERTSETLHLHPGPLRLAIENRSGGRALPGVWIAGARLHDLVGRRRPFLTAKRLLTHQTFRDLYRTGTLDVDQRLKITSLTFLFTDLKGSTGLYERVGDLAAFDLVKTHFRLLTDIVAAEGGAVVKTIGDAVMATFPTPDRAIAAALRMREAMGRLNDERRREELLLKIGIHEGPCLAVTLNDQQDYFGQTVNIAARVQSLVASRSIFATGPVVEHPLASRLLQASGVTPVAQRTALRGIAEEMAVYEIA